MLWRGQHGDVLDTFVVGLAGFLDAAVPGIAGRGGVGRHACILVEWLVGGGKRGGGKKPPGFWSVGGASSGSGGWWVESGRDEKNRRASGASAVAAGSLLSAVHALVIRREAR